MGNTEKREGKHVLLWLERSDDGSLCTKTERALIWLRIRESRLEATRRTLRKLSAKLEMLGLKISIVYYFAARERINAAGVVETTSEAGRTYVDG